MVFWSQFNALRVSEMQLGNKQDGKQNDRVFKNILDLHE
jgi:hypothetical protein